jgi:hypothetical protein
MISHAAIISQSATALGSNAAKQTGLFIPKR